MRWLCRNVILIWIFGIGKSFFFPNSLNGKRILMNGPADTKGKSTTFDGDGIITSVVFKDNNITFSELRIQKSHFRFPLSCLLYTSPSPRDLSTSRMPSSA